jgi:hypothetical protein
MSAEAPNPVAAYIAAANSRDPAAVAACFTDHAVVSDEGRDHRGVQAILEWNASTAKQYQPILEALRVAEAAGKTIVRCRVSDAFPGSPIELNFAFTLEGGKIARLEIAA